VKSITQGALACNYGASIHRLQIINVDDCYFRLSLSLFSFLLSFGYGLKDLVGDITVAGQPIGYVAFIAPALLATSAMNGAIYDSTMNVLFQT
jgi:hypothetical protein